VITLERRSRNSLFALLALAILLVVARLALPNAIRSHLNQLIARNPRYEGSVGEVDVALYRGAYRVHDVEMRKRGGRVPVPFLKAPLVEVSVHWDALLHGKFVGEMVLEQPQLNFVAGPTEAERQTGVAGEGQWRRLVKGLFPAKFNRIEARDGSIHFRDFKKSVDVYLMNVDLVAANLEDAQHTNAKRAGQVEMRGRFKDSGILILHSTVEPDAPNPSFDCDLIIRGADLRAWNDFLRAYAGVDVEHGKLNLYAELLAENGAFGGYLKPFFKDVEVIGWDAKIVEQNPISTAWELVVQAMLEVFRNHRDGDVATRIPIEGSLKTPDAEFWPALGSALYNAFIDGLKPRLEHSVGQH
jgi:hypothetical protein